MPDSQVKAELVASCGRYTAVPGGLACGAVQRVLREYKGRLMQGALVLFGGAKVCDERAEFPDPLGCKKLNNFLSRLFELVFKSDGAVRIAQIKRRGLDGHAKAMMEMRAHTIRRSSRRGPLFALLLPVAQAGRPSTLSSSLGEKGSKGSPEGC